jgi:CRISPR-associated protein Cas2
MAEPRNWYLVIYDVLDEKRLRRVHRICRSWGKPVQYSLFRVRGTKRELARLQFDLAKVMSQDDRLLLVRLCDGCAGRTVAKGPAIEAFELGLDPCIVC